MKKDTLLIWSDFLVPTGFGNVAKNLFSELHQNWDVRIIGINHKGLTDWDPEKWYVYPTTESDPMGYKALIKKATELQPKAILLFQDHFNIAQILPQLKKVSPNSKILGYFPQDCLTLTPIANEALELLDGTMLYTEWSQKIINNLTGKKYPYIYHGVNKEEFKILPFEDIQKNKVVMGWTDKFLAINVNRYQPRKNIQSTLRAWSMFVKGHRTCQMCTHKQPKHLPLCELCMSDMLVETDKANSREDALLYLHMEVNEISMGGPHKGNSLVYAAKQAGFTQQDFNKTLAVNSHKIYGDNPPPVEMINLIYNIADVNLTTTYGEGAGLSLIESAVVGTPSIAPKNSSIPEMLGSYGWQVPNSGVVHLPGDFNNTRPAVDEWKMVQAIEEAYGEWKVSGTLKNAALADRASRLFDWDNIRRTFHQWINGVTN